MTNTDRIAGITARCEAAAPGPWATGINALIVDANGKALFFGPHGKDNAAFIAYARDDIPWLLEQLATLTTEMNIQLEQAIKYGDMCETLTTERDALKEARRWIPVAERLPEEGQEVLLFLQIADGRNLMKVDRKSSAFEGWEFTPSRSVTHWMPLPAAPGVEP